MWGTRSLGNIFSFLSCARKSSEFNFVELCVLLNTYAHIPNEINIFLTNLNNFQNHSLLLIESFDQCDMDNLRI